MRSSHLALLALAAPAVAQNATFLAQLLQEFQNLGLTSLASAAAQLNSTSTGQLLLKELGASKQTVFAPNNQGWSGAHPNITTNPQLLADTLSYHVLPGTFNVTATFPNTTVGRTLLNSSDLVFLEGGESQVLAWSNESDGKVHILNQNTPVVTVVNSTSFQNITINIVDAVIDLPGDFSAALAANNLTLFAQALSSGGLLNPISSQHGVTVFAPSDAAFQAAAANLSAVSSNATLVNDILLNHIINGTSVYTGELIGLGHNLTTAAGEGLGASFNSSGGFITCGNSTAKIVTPDIILWNGVVHIIDHVILNGAVNQAAASSAASSAASAATSHTTESGPIGFTPSATSPGSSGGSGGSSSNAAAGIVLYQFPLKQIGIASAIGTVGVFLGGLLAL